MLGLARVPMCFNVLSARSVFAFSKDAGIRMMQHGSQASALSLEIMGRAKVRYAAFRVDER